MIAQVVKAEEWHIDHIAASIREDDRREMYDYALLTPKEALVKSLAISKLCWTGLADDVPACMFGVAPASILSNTGLVWMIGTNLIDRHQMAFLRRNRNMVKIMSNSFDRLENYVAEYNTRAIAWLKWLGFQFGEPEPAGIFGKPFIKFWKE